MCTPNYLRFFVEIILVRIKAKLRNRTIERQMARVKEKERGKEKKRDGSFRQLKVALLHNRSVTWGITVVVGLATSSTVNVALIQGEVGWLANAESAR